MSATAGTPVKINSSASAQTSFALPTITVTSGQDIIVYFYNNSSTADATGMTDTFATPYTWKPIRHAGTGVASGLWVGYGGSGTSGVITVHSPSVRCGGIAVPAIGASTAPGIIAIDGSNVAIPHGTSGVGPSLTPNYAGELAVYAIGTPNGFSASPVGWTATTITASGVIVAGLATLASPTVGTPLTPTWTVMFSTSDSPIVGALLLPSGLPAAKAGVLTAAI